MIEYKSSFVLQTMNLIRNTILICLLLTPVIVYAFSKQPVEEIQEIEIPVEVEIVEEKVYDYTIAGFKEYATEIVTEHWDSSQVYAFKRIVAKESSWIHNKAHYSDGKSSATGFGGFLNATWGNVGCVRTYDQFVQLDCMVKYIEQRYDTPVNALRFHNSRGWY